MSDKNIYQRVNAVMSECEYLQKKQAQQGKGVRYDEVMAMIRPLLIEHGIVMVTTQLSMQCLNNVEGTKQKIYEGRYSLKLVNMDNPSDFIEHMAFAHGMDGGDKGAGKAHTYAMKTMLVKGFGIETGEDEESRAEKIENSKTISQKQLNEIEPYCVKDGEWTPTGLKMLAAYKINHIADLHPNDFDEALTRAKNHAENYKEHTAG